MNLEQELSKYDYRHPAKSVALEPASPRDSARLLVLDPSTKRIEHDTFRNLHKRLPPKSLLVLNETKVIPARIEATKPTGGRIRILYVADLGQGKFSALADREVVPGMVLTADRKIQIEVLERLGKEWAMRVIGRKKPLDVFLQLGKMPLPPYLKATKLKESEIRDKYQTVFAKNIGSVAAPTASLHLTPRLLRAIEKAGHEIAYVTLHVNLGTFAPLTEENLLEGRLHEEQYEVPMKTFSAIKRAKKASRPVIAFGTTACRALEASANDQKKKGYTRLFIRPGYEFKVVSGLITNFHVPKSSLLMLVSALTGRELLMKAYNKAVRAGYRLFSFGDGMMILPKGPDGPVFTNNRPSATLLKAKQSVWRGRIEV